MRIAWYFGFGWPSLFILVASGFGLAFLRGGLSWTLYLPFALSGIYMVVRFRMQQTRPWRRIHGRVMIQYGKLAYAEYRSSKREGRAFDTLAVMRSLAEGFFGSGDEAMPPALLGEGRKAYYKGLIEGHPSVFTEGIAESKHRAALEAAGRDVDASELGPDIVIARLIERDVGTGEAAIYLRSLMFGRGH